MRIPTTFPTMAVALYCASAAVAHAGDVWDGGSTANDFWTNGNNWNPSTGFQFPPANNGTANLSFPCFGGIVHQPLVDVPYSINSMTFGSGSGRYVILGGAELTIGAGGIVNNDADMQSVIGPVKLNADQTWNAAAGPLQMDAINLNGFALNCTGNFPILLPSLIVGNGSLNVAGGIDVTMSSGVSNSYTGNTNVNNGTLVLQKTGGALAVAGNLLINEVEAATPATVRLAGNEQISQAFNRTVHVYPGGLLDVNTRTETLDTLWLDGGDAVTTGAGKLTARSATVSGATASWSNGGTLYIGDAGYGSLNILNGGDVTNADGYVGSLAGSNGQVAVIGAGSTWNNSGRLYVGNLGTGALSVSSDGALSVSQMFIGNQAGSAGSVMISGAGSTFTSSDFYPGYAGTGTFAVTGGAHATCASASVGWVNGSNGDLDVTGAGSILDLTFSFRVGASGSTASMDITNGGRVNVITTNNESIIRLGGQVHVSDATLDMNNALDMVGGSLTAESNATVDLPSAVITGNAVVNVQTGATFTFTGTLDVSSIATLNVNSGASFGGGFTRVGVSGGTAHLNVDGTGTLVTAPCCIDVGYGGTGEMTITGGAHVQTSTGAVGSFGTNSIGTVTLDGTDASGNPSAWMAGSGPNMGLDATAQGTIHILNGALLQSGGMNVGVPGSGSIFINGSSPSGNPSLLNGGDLMLATAPGANATIDASLGGHVQCANLWLAINGGSAAIALSGAGSSLVQSGSSVTTIGHPSIGSASITCQNNATFTSGTGAITLNPTGQINLNSGGVFDARGPINMNGGAINLLGGTLKAHAVTGSLLNQAGTLAPGHSPGTLGISGNYTQQSGATLQIEIGGIFPGEWDVVAVQGNALVDGTLHVVLIDGFQPVIGNTFTILTTNVGNVAGTFDALIAPSGMQVTYAPHAIMLTVTALPCPADISPGPPTGGDGLVNVNDLLAVISAWGACPIPCPPRCTADIAPIPSGDCSVNVNDLLAVISSWGACP